MTEMKKFLFDNNDFSDAAMAIEIITYSEEQMVLAKEQSFTQGKDEGIRETRQQQEEKITSLMQKALKEIDTLIQSENRREVEKLIEGATLAMSVFKKVLPEMMDKNAYKEIEAAVISNLHAKKDEPRVNIFVNEQHLEFIKKRVSDEIAKNSYNNQVSISSDNNLSPTDCRVEWMNGGAERLYTELLEQIELSFNNAIKGLAIKAEQQ